VKKLLIVTDAWVPQTNGVVTTFQSVMGHLPALGFESVVVHPGLFRTVPLPSYPEIGIARDPWRIRAILESERPDTVHIATEGPLGLYTRALLCRRLIPFTTSLHTKFPEYVRERTGLPVDAGYRYLRWFHRPALKTLCTTESHRRELEGHGLSDLVVWGRGVDTERFCPLPRMARSRPRLLYVGRVAVEKNIEAFLKLRIDAEKIVVGDGPARAELQRRYPNVVWAGYRRGEELVAYYADADVFVFPSRTDTFGLVLLEAMACGTPVAAFPVTGPNDLVLQNVNGCLSEDLGDAVRRALLVDRDACRAFAETMGWHRVARRFVDTFVLVDWGHRHRGLPAAA
jgi:glycosyltransferase involved in cell wall biosynthesis